MESAFSCRGARVGPSAFTGNQHLKIHLLCNTEYSTLNLKFIQLRRPDMPRLLIRGSLIALGLVLSILSILGAAALLLTALVAAPLKKPPPLASISNTARAVDSST